MLTLGNGRGEKEEIFSPAGNHALDSANSGNGHIFMYSSLVFLLGILALVSVTIYLRSLSRKRKNSNAELTSIDPKNGEDSCSNNSTSSFVRLASFPTSISRVQVNRYATSSSSSSSSSSIASSPETSSLAHAIEMCQLDPPLYTSHLAMPQASTSDEDKSPRVSCSLQLVGEKEDSKVTLCLERAWNLRRSAQEIRSPLKSPNCSGGCFEAEGVFARIFLSRPKVNCRLSQHGGCSCKESCEAENVISTQVIKSRRSLSVSFPAEETMVLSPTDFPVRVTLYEVDRSGVRFSLGHTLIQFPTQIQEETLQVKTYKLHSTIYKARNSIKSSKK